MSKQAYSDHCPGCRPAIVHLNKDGTFGDIVPDDDPKMIAVNRVWNEQTTYNQRVAWHRVTCLNSKSPTDLRIAAKISKKVQAAISQLPVDRQ